MTEFDLTHFLKNLTTHPGVYQMYDQHDALLYVGKARNLKKRVNSYFKRSVTDPKTQVLVSKVKSISVTVTASENEALLLESNLIKKLKPRYNILLRDDKSYPYLFLSDHGEYPRLDYYRGAKSRKGDYFGPYPSAGAARETLNLLQKLFKIRQCSDVFFRNRTRPCLQYQIKRCTAPCVKYVTPDEYQQQVNHAKLFLQGKNDEIIHDMAKRMEASSDALDYEAAAYYRDQIANLRRVQEQQYISRSGGDIDVIAIAAEQDVVCVNVLAVRGGRVVGNKSYFPKMPTQYELAEVLTSFIPQYYLNQVRIHAPPSRVITSIELDDKNWIVGALNEQLSAQIEIRDQVRGQQRHWQVMAALNAKHALASHLAGKNNAVQKLEALQQALKLPNSPERLECFDISHTMGEATVASCVVYSTEGTANSDYRRFNIEHVTKGDDYGALQQALTRRYTRLKQTENSLPDVLIIDGGKGQLHVAETVLEELQVSGVIIMAIAKGRSRKPGLETIWLSGREQPLSIAPHSLAFHLLQEIRDEAHRFAITSHRKQRATKRIHSELQDIPGVGAKRRRDLLRHFGGMQEVKRASANEIAKVPGIGSELAKLIFSALHGD